MGPRETFKKIVNDVAVDVGTTALFVAVGILSVIDPKGLEALDRQMQKGSEDGLKRTIEEAHINATRQN